MSYQQMQCCVTDGCLGDCLCDKAAEHFGLCPQCFLNLSLDEVGQLRGAPAVDVIERVRTVYPARSRLNRLMGWAWRLGITAAVAWLWWRNKC